MIPVRAAFVVLALAMVGSHAAQAQPAAPITIHVVLGEQRFEPKVIELNQGQAYILHLTNPTTDKHGLESKAFFATVTYPDWSNGRVHDGDIEVWPGQWNDVAFTPNTPGVYDMHSPDTMNELMGMKGQIVVH